MPAVQSAQSRARARAIRRRRWLAAAAALAAVLGLTGGLVASANRGASSRASGRPGALPPARRAGGAPAPVTFTVEASGDLLIHSPVWEQALADGGGTHYNFAALLARIKPIVKQVDLPLCHVETPMTPAPPTGYPIFNTPPALATAIAQTGFKACSNAGTHSLDQGQIGIEDTNRYLDRAGVLHTGEFSSAAQQRTPLILTVKGVKVAFLAYTAITNGIPSPHPWSVNRASAPQILADAHRARLAGARVVIVNIHWGDEYVTRPSGLQLGLATVLTASPDITAVVGQHVHVAQPIQWINGKPVVFGEGNLISNQTDACCPTASQDGLMAIISFRVDGHGARATFVRYVPVWVQHPSFVVLPIATGLRVDPADASLLRASYARTVAAAGRGPRTQPIPASVP
jgi:poly-gamma-glutamate synthesis protein (capsule biosynthesis protein)